MSVKRGKARLIRQSVILAGVIGLGAYGVTIAWLTHFDRSSAPPLSASSATRKDPIALAAFNALRGARCDYCHTENAQLPFYFKIPVARQLMAKDLRQGLRHFRYEPVLKAFDAGLPPSVEQLSRIEEVVTQNRMPPSLFLLMHWHAYLMPSERAAILTWIRQTRRNYYATPDVAPQHAEEVIQPIPEQIQVNWDRAALGKKLFFERRLSGDGKLNCASCHGLDKAGVDNLKTATGINGQKGPINSPTVYNAVFNIAQFWDGRAVDLAAQAAGPVTNPLEMGAHDWDTVVATLKSDPEYVADFQRIYGSDALTKGNITNAIAEYERTLITPDSPFDLYLKGDDNAITTQEKHGYALFKQVGCSGCHSGVALGGDAYEVMGLEGPYFTDRNTPLTQADIGRQSFTKALSDYHRFKVPNLRNVALTAPYFHDGSAPTLDDAVKKMVRYQTPAGTLSQGDIDDIVAFLKTLTGKFQGVPLQETPENPPLRSPADSDVDEH
ncbi:cytochrome-c peroxidase [Candidatus Kirkpatrickella diaphorinae]|uniref:Cytochrome-c peroxidase n=1 Tax=Candidatus Kirkpatrickella diaphorinae TaxID=2984322 RepID=A0ABY6GKR1_9PROT|nr:cytochrome-c peroxidase [Candidatus Kirkpatrickella diaphorinae]UYH52130.1 cytochrome-c peroxidase [Candidatus Kirkpatrickella diaphorinae]